MSSQQPHAPTEETSAWFDEDAGSPISDLTGKLLGDFQVERLLGRGGMGEVYLATQVSLNRPVAIKVLRPHCLSRPSYLSRFESEAMAVARLNHPSIVHVYTLGLVEGVRFIAMEYVEGTNLRDYLIKKGALDLPLALSIMRQSGQAIGAAGEVGLIHRDIKPENLLLSRKGRVKVADFGLCRDSAPDRLHLTQEGMTMGTPLYMSPEQSQGHSLDHRSDLYSLGVTFYHMLAGEPPFRADSAVALALKHVKEAPISLRVHRPEVPVELDRLVLKLMAKSPDDRYQSAAEMLADLGKIRGNMQTGPISLAPEEPAFTASRPSAPAASAPLPALDVSAESAKSPEAGTRAAWISPRLVMGVSALFLAAGVGLGWFTRPNSLSAGSATRSARSPGLGIDPDWALIPKQQNAEEQYRHALLTAPEDQLGAAWLAVAGHFPHSYDWVSPSYLQYARLLYRERDQERLAALAGELSTWSSAQTRDQELVDILDAAGKMLHKDLDGVTEVMTRITGRTDRTIYDPGLLEFAAEVVGDALRLSSQPGPPALTIQRPRLLGIQGRLMPLLNRVRSLGSGGNGRAG